MLHVREPIEFINPLGLTGKLGHCLEECSKHCLDLEEWNGDSWVGVDECKYLDSENLTELPLLADTLSLHLPSEETTNFA